MVERSDAPPTTASSPNTAGRKRRPWRWDRVFSAVKMCKHWDVKPWGVADDAIFAKGGHAAGSIADEFSRAGVSFTAAKKADRITGWNIMRRLLADAGKPDKPGLYISRHCSYLWETLPTLARDQKRVEDVDSTGPDHGADAVRYGCLRRTACVGGMIKIRGMY